MNGGSNKAAGKKHGIYLVGFSGTGKSTIARLIAGKMSCPAFDLDQLIVEASGMPIPLIFEREGEEGFRRRESEALRTVSSQEAFVVATGGGAVLREENRRLMSAHGWIVCLEGRPETLHARLQAQLVKESGPEAVRPLLDAPNAEDDPLEKLRTLKQSRQSIYALADWTVHTDRLTPEQVAAEVVRAVELLESSGK
jgi:shikimate kinase